MLEPDIWLVVATIMKAVTYGATFSASGGVIFCVLFRDKISQKELESIRGYVLNTSLVAILISILRFFVTNIILSGEFSGIFDLALTRMVLESNEGFATGLRLASLIFILSFCRNKYFDKYQHALLIAAIVATTSFSLVGHAGEVAMKQAFRLIPQGLLFLHLIAVAFWVGSLWPLKILSETNDSFSVAKIMHLFGQKAVMFVSLLIVSGLLLIWLLLGKLNLLWTSVYGQLLLLKLTSVFVLLTIAAINKFRITPKLFSTNSKFEMCLLRKSIIVELVLVGLIFFITSSFTTLVGPS